MDARAHALLQIDPGRSQDAVSCLSGLQTVREAVVTTGAYDVIAVVQATSDEALGAAVAKARRTPGLCALRLCRPA